MNDRYIGHRSNQLEQSKVAVMMFSEGIFGLSRWLSQRGLSPGGSMEVISAHQPVA